ncbi:ribonuclease 1 [Brachypodium distachyon]|uniref:Uncharacterized protein n=1 Tax=Brachypodium distachyon TaxID=15368 RepID=I1GS23_BRADI|nr:ribonuclease 1 [Brachypodium distachyon]KQK15082.1 hypothetical protein BRADI_1g20520v3 [Brachypodium distachyon]PNT74697.1 hypothetical protein BRADI_1g20520v3 [Brachypodium distachyon]|eukprot:XP_003562632.1 ribonuclease 1 [Brachypodium distachyon]
MKLALSFLLLASLLVAVSSSSSAAEEEFDFFYLVQQWPGSFCDTRQGCCFPDDTGRPATGFGIHGLWPNYAKCKTAFNDEPNAAPGLESAINKRRKKKCWPEYCNNGEPLKLGQIADLLATLNANWGTLSCKNKKSFTFWAYEWKKHGTCSGLAQHDYFQAALRLKAQHNLTGILAQAGIVPSDDKTYFLSSIRDAIKEGTGFKANLECNRGVGGETQLFQVYQCVDVSGEKLIDCPLPMQGNCQDRVQLPAF